ncbi:MAG: MucR family transcriptional regulator [Alphaproteobacteria bacterium]|nr:MucR family transcriptional regulator [Alphaproteobacteria bacterium]
MTERAEPKKAQHDELLRMTTDVVAAYLSQNRLGTVDLPRVIDTVYASLAGLNGRAAPVGEALKPAVAIKRSVTPDHIVCLEDGKKLKMLKRHLRTAYGLSPEAYRAKWGLPADYPMVAPNYSAQRSAFAKKIGLGRGRRRERAE